MFKCLICVQMFKITVSSKTKYDPNVYLALSFEKCFVMLTWQQLQDKQLSDLNKSQRHSVSLSHTSTPFPKYTLGSTQATGITPSLFKDFSDNMITCKTTLFTFSLSFKVRFNVVNHLSKRVVTPCCTNLHNILIDLLGISVD